MRYRNVCAIGLSALAGVIIAASTAARAELPPLPQSVADSQRRFAMNFPSDWEVVTQAQSMVALLGAGPLNAGSRPTINVVTESLAGPMSPQAYAAAAQRLASVTLHNYAVIQESNAAVQGRPAYYRYMTWEMNTGVTLYQLQVFFTEGLTGFVITGSTINEPERVLRDMPLITRIIETFRVAQAPPTN